MRRRGFTLVEVIIAIMILGILAGTMTLSSKGARQTARKEAEKVAALLSSAVVRADRMNLSFDATINTGNNSITISWDRNAPIHMLNNPLKSSTGCNYYFSKNANGKKFTYAPMNYPNSVLIKTEKDSHDIATNNSNIYFIGVTDDKAASYCVLISGDYHSRPRT